MREKAKRKKGDGLRAIVDDVCQALVACICWRSPETTRHDVMRHVCTSCRSSSSAGGQDDDNPSTRELTDVNNVVMTTMTS